MKQRKWPVKVTPLSELTEEEMEKGCNEMIAHCSAMWKKYNNREIVRMLESGEVEIRNWDMDISIEEYIRQVKAGTYEKA